MVWNNYLGKGLIPAKGYVATLLVLNIETDPFQSPNTLPA